ncbi:hypothetical protein ACFXTH_033629 [Malus domestica]
MIVVADSLTVEPPSTFESNNDRMLDFNGENNRHFGPVMVAIVSPVESLETHSFDQNDRWHCQTVPKERIKMDWIPYKLVQDQNCPEYLCWGALKRMLWREHDG